MESSPLLCFYILFDSKIRHVANGLGESVLVLPPG